MHTHIVGATTAYSKWNHNIFYLTDGLPNHGGLEPSALPAGTVNLRSGLHALCVAVIYRV